MSHTHIELIAFLIFILAVLHTFLCFQLQAIASKFPEGSILKNLFHLLGEVEVAFGLWAVILIGLIALADSGDSAIKYSESLNFTEPLFVFAIMTIASTRPVIQFANRVITWVAGRVPFHPAAAGLTSCLIIGPLLGSFITEPAAMTVTALILKDRFFSKSNQVNFKYAILGVLFVNISVGGVLTPFAAPPVLMVAKKWGWDISFMMRTFGWKAILAVISNAAGITWLFRAELRRLHNRTYSSTPSVPEWMTCIHLLFLALVVLNAHHAVIFIGLFLLFMGFTSVTREYQDKLLFKQSLLVAVFLGGLIVMGGLQNWWIQPLLGGISDLSLFFGATGLTAIADNAALTYLGSQIGNSSADFPYALVAGALAGGGLTVIANAPNPAGFAILQDTFGQDGIRPLRLFVAALVPTCIVLLIFGFY